MGPAGSAIADDRPFAVPPGNTTPPAEAAAQLNTPADGPVQIAKAKAKSTGKTVTVDELTSETSITVANPDGTLTRTDHLQAARVRKGGTWTAVDGTLARNGNGTWSPKATPSGVAISGGGTGPLATFTDPQGRSLAITLPFALPTPTVSGSGATYTDVLPGVDLKASVTDQGAFREVLIVHDATAAANPALKSLRLATTANGLTTSADQDGNITVKASDGTPVFTAPTPVMWDSTSTQQADATAKTVSAPAAAETATAPTAAGSTAVDASDVAVSSDKGPGRDAHIAPIGVAADGTGVTLTPDQGQLSGTGTTWPVYIDPYVNPVPGRTNHYTEVQEGCPGATLYDQAQANGEGAGYQHYPGGCTGTYRSFYEFDISNLDARMVVSNSTLYFTETYGADNGCGNTWPVSVTLTGSITKDTVWPGPNVDTELGWQNVASSSIDSHCGNHPVNFDVTSAVRQHLTNKILTFGLKGDEGKYGTNYGFMRFSTNPYIQTTFDVPPNPPGQLGTTPASKNPDGPACGQGSPGWIGLTTMNGNASNLTLDATVSTDMSGVNLKAGYHVWDNMVNNGSGSPADAAWPVSPTWVATGTPVHTSIGRALSDGHQYGWNVWATDGTLSGPSSPYCYFNVDLSAPTLAAVAPSTVFPPLGSGTQPTGHAGDSVTFTVSSTDPTPTGCNLVTPCLNSGVSGFQWSLDNNIPAVGAQFKAAGAVVNGKQSADIAVDIPATQWGTHTLYVRAVDNAGNTQPTAATYSFYAPWNPTTKVTEGDLTGDGIPDMLATTNDGNLALLAGNTDLSAAPTTASAKGQSPERDGWDKYLIAHRGSMTQQNSDDLFALDKSPGSEKLYIYKNDATASGTPGHFTLPGGILGPIPRPNCAVTAAGDCTGYTKTDWSPVSQMVAAGALSTAAYNADHSTTYKGTPELITVENGKLWYYLTTSTSVANAYQIGSGDWNNTTLVGAGLVGVTVTGTGSTATKTGGTPALWARNNATGAINTYPLTFDNNTGTPTVNLAAPSGSALRITAGGPCLDVLGGTDTDGTPLQVAGCDSTAKGQTFTLGTDNTVHTLGKCLDVNGAGKTAGSAVQLATCNNGSSQQWTPRGATSQGGSDTGALINTNSGLCLNATGPAGARVQLGTCDAGTNQNWSGATGGTLPAAQPVLPIGIGSATYSTLSTPGDVTGDGNPELYAIGTGGRITSYSGAPVPTAQATDRWKLADTTDSIRTNNLTLGGVAAPGIDGGRNALIGNGTSVYATSATTSVDTSKSFTVSAWVKLSSLTSNSTFVEQAGTNSRGFQLYYSSANKAFAFGRGLADDTSGSFNAVYGPASGSNTPTTGTWYHLAGTYDATTQELDLYVNGTKTATTTYSGVSWNATGPVHIGRRFINGYYAEYMNGSISDVQTYNTVMPAQAIRAIATGAAQFNPASTLGYLQTPDHRWKLTDNKDTAGKPAQDLNLTGTAAIGPDPTTNGRGTVLNLPGASGSGASTTGSALDTSKSFTVSAWAYLKNTNTHATVVAQSGSSVSSFYLQYSASFNAWTFIAPSTDSTSPTTYYAAYAATPPATNRWTHLVATYDANTKTMSLYIDGSLAAATTNPTAWTSASSATSPLTIGYSKTGDYFPGMTSDIQTWNTALNPTTIATLDNGTPLAAVQLS